MDLDLISLGRGVLESEASCVSFLQSFSIVPQTKTCVCGSEMRMIDVKHRSGNEKCSLAFSLVPDRRATALIPITQDNVALSSTIVTDEWSAYNGLTSAGYSHLTVNRTKNYKDPVSGYHTQGIERAWQDAKAWLNRAKYPTHLIQSHLDLLSWKKRHKNSDDGLLAEFLRDVRKYYVEE